MEEMIKELLAEIIEDDSAKKSWNCDTDIINDIGIDSLQLVRFLLAVENRLGMTLDYEDLKFEYFSSIRTLAEYLEEQVDKIQS
ncbi:MAG: acyl carrier protein [Erysipelotrichaceae bacterium]|nr:acyl carrier protein [Erysipelotrichaceae bacterium]